MGRKLVVLFDGTWNNRSDRTNVIRFRESLDSGGRDDLVQPCFYDPGVGTHWYDRMTGGAFGRGLSENIRQGYRWVAETCRDGDELFVLGFSRGAYTARSLVGFIRKCGLVNAPSEALVHEAYAFYRNKEAAPDGLECVAFRQRCSREIRIRFIGVWDTVGALGIPASHVPFSRDFYRWHDTELSKIVDHAYQTIAADEHRKDYCVTVWSKIKPENTVEQRWFVGAHANVGGGYGEDLLANPPLRWIQDKADSVGLKFKSKCVVGPQDHLAPIRDSFGEFMFGLYRRFSKEFHRPFGTGANEVVDETCFSRQAQDPTYHAPGPAS